MPRGLPDYYNPDTLVSQRLANVEEVVTAVQGIANLDNRGRTYWFTNFKDGIGGWDLTSGGDGSNPVSSTAEALIAPNSMLLDAGTDAGSGYSRARKLINIRNVKKAGLEFSFHYRNTLAELDAVLNYNDGTEYVQGLIRIDRVAKAIQISDGAIPTTIATLPTAPSIGEWTTIKFVIDLETGTYDRLLIGLTQIDVSGYDLYFAGAAHPGLMRAGFYADALDDGSNIAYIGHTTITIDEP